MKDRDGKRINIGDIVAYRASDTSIRILQISSIEVYDEKHKEYYLKFQGFTDKAGGYIMFGHKFERLHKNQKAREKRLMIFKLEGMEIIDYTNLGV